MLFIGLKGLEKAGKELQKWADKKLKEIDKAATYSLKRTGATYYKKLKKDLKDGTLGLAPKSKLGKRAVTVIKSRNRKPTKEMAIMRRYMKRNLGPLAGLAKGVSYHIHGITRSFTASGSIWHANMNKLGLELGFLGAGFPGSARFVGTKWQVPIVKKSIRGYRFSYTKQHRAKLHEIGVHLLKTTTSATVPPRDIMEAFLAKEGHMMLQNFISNFNRKMSGERI